jgi:hypothetical protein
MGMVENILELALAITPQKYVSPTHGLLEGFIIIHSDRIKSKLQCSQCITAIPHIIVHAYAHAKKLL